MVITWSQIDLVRLFVSVIVVWWHIIFGQLYQLMEDSALEVAFIYNLVHEIGREVLSIVLVGVALDDFRDEQTSFDSAVHQVQEKVEVLEHVVLTIWVVVAALEEEIDNCLKEFLIIEFLEDESLQEYVEQVIDQVDVPNHILKFPEAHWILTLKLLNQIIQDVLDVDLGVPCLSTRALLVDHMVHFVLHELIRELFELPLLAQEVDVLLMVQLAHDDVCPYQFLHQQVPLVEVLDKHLQGKSTHVDVGIILENVVHEDQIKWNSVLT